MQKLEKLNSSQENENEKECSGQSEPSMWKFFDRKECNVFGKQEEGGFISQS